VFVSIPNQRPPLGSETDAQRAGVALGVDERRQVTMVRGHRVSSWVS
jgi:hypothetical protein